MSGLTTANSIFSGKRNIIFQLQELLASLFIINFPVGVKFEDYFKNFTHKQMASLHSIQDDFTSVQLIRTDLYTTIDTVNDIYTLTILINLLH